MKNPEEDGYIFEKGFDGFEHFFKREDYLKTTKKFEEWAKSKKLKGIGSLDNPYIIDPSVELPEILYMSNIDVSVLIVSLDSKIINFKKCKNFTLKDCKFTKLTFLKCSDLTTIDSDTKVLNVLKSKDLEFKNCKISTLFDYYSNRIKYLECGITSDYFKEHKAYPDKRILYLVVLLTLPIPFLILLALFLPRIMQSSMFLVATALAIVTVYLITKKTIIGKEIKKKN